MTGDKGKDYSDAAKESFVSNSFLYLSMIPVYNTEEMTARHDFGGMSVNIDCEVGNTTRIEK